MEHVIDGLYGMAVFIVVRVVWCYLVDSLWTKHYTLVLHALPRGNFNEQYYHH